MSARILTAKQIKAIARDYDGCTETIDRLVKQYGLERYNVHRAAKLGGYRSARRRIDWTKDKDDYLIKNWGRLPPAEIYSYLDCSPSSVFNRLKRLNHSTRKNEDLTIYDIEHLTKIDHRLWRRFIDDGWLKSYAEYGRNGAIWSRRVAIGSLIACLLAHPEIFDYRAADKYTRAVFELDKLPEPPKFKQLTCRSDAWKDGEKLTPAGYQVHHGEIQMAVRHHHHSLKSCAAEGGTDFWAPIYASPLCPRCGCTVSRFSEKAVFMDNDPGDGDALNAIAGKLGLTWCDGKFLSADGKPVNEDELLRFVFSTKRQPSKALATFRRLLAAGMSVAPPNPVPEESVLTNVMRYGLRKGQQKAFKAFLASGNVGVYWPPGIGKMYFLGTIFARISGEHALFVHNRTVQDQWLAFFREHARDSHVAYVKTPHHYRVDIRDAQGEIRSIVRIFNYVTRVSFDDKKFVVVGFDEAQFLPGNNASRLSTIDSEYRVGLSATPFREDGRADLIQLMTGLALGEDWQEFKDAGQIAEVPVRVVVVDDLEQKYRALARCLRNRKTIVFSDAIADGERIAQELQVPFIFSKTNKRLQVLSEHQVVIMSRVGDCGIDTQDLEEVIEFNFHHGSRSQSLQRMGRLLHSRKPLLHTVLMTVKEFSLYHKRLSALESKGFPIRIEIFKESVRKGRPPAPKPVNVWAQLLGVTPVRKTSQPLETQAQKRSRVMRRIQERTSRAV